jgi:hypothetical protein
MEESAEQGLYSLRSGANLGMAKLDDIALRVHPMAGYHQSRQQMVEKRLCLHDVVGRSPAMQNPAGRERLLLTRAPGRLESDDV